MAKKEDLGTVNIDKKVLKRNLFILTMSRNDRI